VADDGCGIDREDAVRFVSAHLIHQIRSIRMALRCCTSKITGTDDIENLQTYGFRGEALHSLCSVAQVTVTTATKDDDMRSVFVLNSNGDIVSTKQVASSGHGTVICAQNIFSSIPVRRKQYETLESKKAELVSIQDLLSSYALVHPEVRLTLRCGPQPAINWVKHRLPDTKQSISSLFGQSVASDLALVEHTDGDLSLQGYLPSPHATPRNVTRSANDRFFTYVNRRPVAIKCVQKLIRHIPGITSGVDEGESRSKARYPFVVLMFTLPPNSYDVNVEPDKTVLLFHDEQQLVRVVSEIVQRLYPATQRSSTQTEIQSSPHSSEKAAPMLVDDAPSSSSEVSHLSSEHSALPVVSQTVIETLHLPEPEHVVSHITEQSYDPTGFVHQAVSRLHDANRSRNTGLPKSYRVERCVDDIISSSQPPSTPFPSSNHDPQQARIAITSNGLSVRSALSSANNDSVSLSRTTIEPIGEHIIPFILVS
jgi:DNA mismatch repair protein PMS1